LTDPATLRLRIVSSTTATPQNTYAITSRPGETSFERIARRQPRADRLRLPARGSFEADSDLELTVRRDGWRIVFILDRQVLARAWDSSLSGGQVGYTITGGEIPDAMVQPLGGDLHDRRLHAHGRAVSVWEVVSGTWKTESLRVDEQSERMEEDKSVNAFSYWGKARRACDLDDRILVLEQLPGHRGGASYRSRPRRPGGLSSRMRRTTSLARWTSACPRRDDADRLQLIAVSDGSVSVLAESPGGHLPGQWYQLQLRVCDRLSSASLTMSRGLPRRTSSARASRALLRGRGGVFFDSMARDATGRF
jgi:hypothetical protein